MEAGFDDIFIAYPGGGKRQGAAPARPDRPGTPRGGHGQRGGGAHAGRGVRGRGPPARRPAQGRRRLRPRGRGSREGARGGARARRAARAAPSRDLHPCRPRLRSGDTGGGSRRGPAGRRDPRPGGGGPAGGEPARGGRLRGLHTHGAPRSGRTGGHRVPSRQLRHARRFPGGARDLRPRGLRAHDPGHGHERAGSGPRGAGCGEQDPLERPPPSPAGRARPHPGTEEPV